MTEYKFYKSYIDLLDEDYEYLKSKSFELSPFEKMLKHNKFRTFVIEYQGKTFNTIVNIKNVMLMGMLRPQRLLIDNHQFYMACDMITNTYYLCFKYLMMIDIDFYKKDNPIDKEKNIQEIKDIFIENVKSNPSNCWRLYQTKGGVHAFLTSKKSNYNTKESCELMIKLGSDFNYVVYSYLRGWCLRINRKKLEEVIINNYLETIGSSKLELEEHLKLLNLHERMIKVFKDEDPSMMYGV